ncbi:MAG: IS3 family transposase [Pedobacter sp.]|nr:MAG: IS3 family transposase [Pedobacter sp.]
MRRIAAVLGYSRQYVYKQQTDQHRQASKEGVVKALVHQQRQQLPRIGTRKLYYLIKANLIKQDIKFGRDKLFALMKRYDLKVKPRRRYTQTTMSKHWLRKWPNIAKHIFVTRPDQVWVSDITYLKTEQGNCYLNMITDVFSRKIVGFAVDDNMETKSMITALDMAIKQRRNPALPTVHHSDRGLQYCSKEYVQMTADNNLLLSMTENGDPYENALAERMNRTIKEEFGLDQILASKAIVKPLVAQSIHLYNQKRPHLALNLNTPNAVYQAKIPVT